MQKRLSMLLACLLFFVGMAMAQTKVTGTVMTSENGQDEPVIGASVMIKGTKQGTVTDVDGNFTLQAPKGATLVVSYIGLKTQEVKAQSKLRIFLESDSHSLGEVVVTGMTAQDKRLFSGAASKIDASDAKLDGVADISRSLEGRAAGVSVQNVSGTFGTAPKIRVRGATSIYGSSKPLDRKSVV